MLIQDMHNYLDVKLNKINSNLYENLLPEEKDYAININIERFVKQHYNPSSNLKGKGFEETQKRIDDLRSLLVPNYIDGAYTLPSSDPDFQSKVRFSFPANYLFLTSSRSKVYFDFCKTPTFLTVPATKKYWAVPFDISRQGDSFEDFDIQLNTVSIFPSGFSDAISNLSNPEDAGVFKDTVLSYINMSTDFEAYWQYYKGVFLSNTIIIASKTGTETDAMEIIWSTETVDAPINSLSLTKNISSTVNPKYVPNNFFQQNDVYTSAQDPFNDTYFDNPSTIITDNYIDVFYDPNKFVVSDVIISYIRKPNRVSFSGNIHCDLPEHTHEEILDLTVKYMLENFESPRYATTKDLNTETE